MLLIYFYDKATTLVLSQKLTEVLELEEKELKFCGDAQEMIIECLQLLWFMTTINYQAKCKAADSLQIETLFELMQKTESRDMKVTCLLTAVLHISSSEISNEVDFYRKQDAQEQD